MRVRLRTFVAPGGTLLVIARGPEPAEPEGVMPWPLTRDEVEAARERLTLTAFEDSLRRRTRPYATSARRSGGAEGALAQPSRAATPTRRNVFTYTIRRPGPDAHCSYIEADVVPGKVRWIARGGIETAINIGLQR